MNTKSMTCLGLALLVASNLLAQPFSVPSYSIAGGGGTSSAGRYSVTGTLGPFDAGTLTGGSFRLSGGFWGEELARLEPPRPRLTIAWASHDRVLIAWPAWAVGWTLERNSDVIGGPYPWVAMPLPYQTNNGVISTYFTNVSISLNQFFRLRQ